MASAGWTQQNLSKLKTMATKGISTAEIGKRLGMTKNAVVGKLNRMGWNAKALTEPAGAKKTPAKKVPVATKKKTVVAAKPIAKKPAAAKVVKKSPTKAAPEKAAKAVAKPTPVKISAKTDQKTLARHMRIVKHSLEMANLKPDQCRWPIGDPDSEGFHFCGAPVFVGKPYCYEHCRAAYQFTQPKGAAAAAAAAEEKKYTPIEEKTVAIKKPAPKSALGKKTAPVKKAAATVATKKATPAKKTATKAAPAKKSTPVVKKKKK